MAGGPGGIGGGCINVPPQTVPLGTVSGSPQSGKAATVAPTARHDAGSVRSPECQNENRPVAAPGVAPGGIIPLGMVLVGIAMYLVSRTTTGPVSAGLAGTLVAAQIAAIVWLLTRRLAVVYRAALIGTALAAVASAALALGLTARSAGLAVAGICHAAAYSALLLWFAGSLRPGHEPVVTQFARQMRRTMPAEVVRYTGRVTIAWCVFFAAQLGLSGALLAFAPEAVWSSFVNLLNLPLTVAMALAEFGCRSLLFRHDNRTGLLATLQGLRRIRS